MSRVFEGSRPRHVLRAGLVVGLVLGPLGAAARADRIVHRAPNAAVVVTGEARDAPVVGIVDPDAGYLGVKIEEEIDHPDGGARVTRVVPGSPAEEAGLVEGDVIVEFDGNVVRGPAALTRRIHEKKDGDRVRIRIRRGDKLRVLETELAGRADRVEPVPLGEFSVIAPLTEETLLERLRGQLELQDDSLQGIGDRVREGLLQYRNCLDGNCLDWWGPDAGPRLGVQLIETTPELRRHLGGTDESGVLVSKVLTGTPAERAEIRVGDLIVGINGNTVGDVASLRRELRGNDGETIRVELIRDGEPLSIEVALPAMDDEPTGPRARNRDSGESPIPS